MDICLLQMVVWTNVLIGSCILIGTCILVYLLFTCVQRLRWNVFHNHNHLLQLILSMIFLIGIVISIYEAFGYKMAYSLLTGIGIAFGLALQPVMKKMVAGVIFDTTLHGKYIKIGDVEGTICDIGVVHTWIKTKEGNKICIHNDYFNSHPVEIVTKPEISSSDTQPVVPLKYW